MENHETTLLLILVKGLKRVRVFLSGEVTTEVQEILGTSPPIACPIRISLFDKLLYAQLMVENPGPCVKDKDGMLLPNQILSHRQCMLS